MKSVNYSKYRGDLASEMDLEDLLKALSDYFLDSGFRDPYSNFQDLDQSLDALREALRQALENGSFEDSIRQKLDEMMASHAHQGELHSHGGQGEGTNPHHSQ